MQLQSELRGAVPRSSPRDSCDFCDGWRLAPSFVFGLHHCDSCDVCDTLVAASAGRALERVTKIYLPAEISAYGFDLFSGSLNVRKMRGGSAWSMHSWGIAIDFDTERNQLRWGRDRAFLARPECAAFLDAFEAEGWVSLGRERNYDWMHVQAARL